MDILQIIKESKINKIRRHILSNKKKKFIQRNPIKYAEKKYENCFNMKPNLDNPKTFNEKTLWISVFYQNPLYTKCADKIEVKEYLIEKLGEKEANKLICERYGVWSSVDDIEFEKLPREFVLKSNHASGHIIICNDKSKIDINKVKKVMKKWMKTNYYYLCGEWQYKDIKPKIICEKLLQSDIVDYRIFCFEGNPIYIKTTRHSSVSSGGYDSAIYYADWEKVEFKMDQSYGEMEIEKPKHLDYMLEIARRLSEDFHFVRVDLYSVGEEIYFAELTFTPNSSCEKFENMEVDERFGSMFTLPDDMYVKRGIE